ncbi:hypothetical protein BH24PSE2_BH24PSE2_11120 [soil metagenome]
MTKRPPKPSPTGPAEAGGPSRVQSEQRLQRLAWLLDNSIPLPGGYRVGVDGLIGLIPGVGDAVGALLSSYIVMEAARLGASRSLLTRMGFNVLVETIIGAIPILGDLFDFAFKANARNVRLLEGHVREPARHARSNRTIAAAVIVGVVIVVILVVWGFIALMGALLGAISD